MTAYDQGRRRGERDAISVLDLSRGYSAMKRSFPDGMPDEVPMGFDDRARWLEGYAAGITTVVLANAYRFPGPGEDDRG